MVNNGSLNDFDVLLAVLGGGALAIGLVSQRLAAGPFPPALVALAIGVGLGPEVLGLVDPFRIPDPSLVLERGARITLGIGLVGVALRIPAVYLRQNWRPMALLLGLGMPSMWAITGLLAYGVLDLPFWQALLVGAVLTPTDPVAAGTVASGALAERKVPPWIRNTISFESGANDGLGYLFVLLPLHMLTRSPEEALGYWFMHTLLWEVCGATVTGLLLGHGAAVLLSCSTGRHAISPEWRSVYTVALALFTVGVERLMHGDEVLAAFAAGVAFTQAVGDTERKEAWKGLEGVNRFFAIPIFMLIGTALPWGDWLALGWHGILFAVSVLVLRRLPVLLLLRRFLPLLGGLRNTLFVGWFGPIAVSAVYYAALIVGRIHDPLVWPLVSLIVCASVVAHGMSGAVLTRWIGSRSEMEGDP